MVKKTVGVILIGWLYTAFGMITDTISKLVQGGYVDAKDVGAYVIAFLAALPGEITKLVGNNQKLLLVSVGAIAAVVIYRDLKKFIAWLFTLYTGARKDLNTLEIIPDTSFGHPWWAFWR
jgi:hypothetical protein